MSRQTDYIIRIKYLGNVKTKNNMPAAAVMWIHVTKFKLSQTDLKAITVISLDYPVNLSEASSKCGRMGELVLELVLFLGF